VAEALSIRPAKGATFAGLFGSQHDNDPQAWVESRTLGKKNAASGEERVAA
jgi:hypothetical protein